MMIFNKERIASIDIIKNITEMTISGKIVWHEYEQGNYKAHVGNKNIVIKKDYFPCRYEMSLRGEYSVEISTIYSFFRLKRLAFLIKKTIKKQKKKEAMVDKKKKLLEFLQFTNEIKEK